MPPTAKKERAGKSMLDSADAVKNKKNRRGMSSGNCSISPSRRRREKERERCFSPGDPKANISVAVV